MFREFVMSETEVISRRRALSFLGLAALAAVVPAAILPISEAEAQQPSPPTAPRLLAPRRRAHRPARSDVSSGAQPAPSGVRSGA